MSIKTQKKLKYIPIANFIIMFVWISVYFKYRTKMTDFLKNLFKIFGGLLLVNLPRIILSFIGCSDFILSVLYWISLYFSLFLIAHISIKDEERIFAENETTKV